MSVTHNFSIIAGIMGKVVGPGDPTISAVSTIRTVNEGSPVTVTVLTRNFPDGNTVLSWGVGFDGSSSQDDFEQINGTVTITSSNGFGSNTFTVTPRADGIVEPDETFTVTVSGQVNGKTISTTSSGYTIRDTVETVSLGGTVDTAVFAITTNESGSCFAGWSFNTDGSITYTPRDYDGNFSAIMPEGWCNVTPTQEYFIRCTLRDFSYSLPESHLDGQFDVWLSLATVNRQFSVADNVAGRPPSWESYKIEIASDANGTNILATGYYRATAFWLQAL